MHAVVRNYSGAGAKQLFGLLEQRKADVEAVIYPRAGAGQQAIERLAAEVRE